MSMAAERLARSMMVPHHAEGARLARQRLAVELSDLVSPALLADVVVVAAELLGNAVRHAAPLPGGMIRLSWLVGPAADSAAICVKVRVTDGGATGLPVARLPDPDSVDGRGLAIVSALARRWGVERLGGSQCVWAEIGVPGARRGGARGG